MKKINRTIIGIHQSFHKAVFLSAMLFTVTLLTACSPKNQPGDDLAVAKIPIDKMHATNFLPLNADKPGTPVDVQRYVVPGKYTIVAYFSPYDAPSMSLQPKLLQLSQINNTLAVRTVDINRPGIQGIDWQSPVVQDAAIRTLPYFRIYDPGRALRAQARPAYEQIRQWIQTLPK